MGGKLMLKDYIGRRMEWFWVNHLASDGFVLWRRAIKWACKQAQSMAGTVGCYYPFPQSALPFFLIVCIKLLESFFGCL
jgi:hypothetical protein